MILLRSDRTHAGTWQNRFRKAGTRVGTGQNQLRKARASAGTGKNQFGKSRARVGTRQNRGEGFPALDRFSLLPEGPQDGQSGATVVWVASALKREPTGHGLHYLGRGILNPGMVWARTKPRSEVPGPGQIFLTKTVPAAVPSVLQSSRPLTLSVAAKKT